MAEAYDHLKDVKEMIGEHGTYNDSKIKWYIEEAKGFMASAGVPPSVIESRKASSVIAIAVNDLWILQKDEPSKYFYKRCGQLYYEDGEKDIAGNHEKYHISKERIEEIIGVDIDDTGR